MCGRFAVIFFICVIQIHWSHVASLKLSPKQQLILNDVSWKLKVKFLNKFMANKQRRRNVNIQSLILSGKNNHNELSKRNSDDVELVLTRKKNVQLAQELKRHVAVDFLRRDNTYPVTPQILDDDFESSLSFEEKSDTNNDLNFEQMGVHDGLQTDHSDLSRRHLYRRQEGGNKNKEAHQVNEAETERDMKLKLFRLMYDTVKDNDDLVRKADTIKKSYEHSNFFEIGFVMGAITDKVNTMSDVALTVERLYDEWKPIEHVNAYEQIANLAIEINHLIDILQSAYKKTKKYSDKDSKKETKQESKNVPKKEEKGFKYL